ncbi:MAG: DUF1801 domain-containing protein [Reichenbachiella sp.]|uniref:DUF1801 domain-containing protein n=1 Tax=Reichenbachiella sp. TaxID=2184521 RepID=UPI003265EF16
MHPDLASFFLTKEEPAKSCLYALREIVLHFDPNIKETKKYGMPCYLYGEKAFCYIWTDKKSGHPYLLIVEGGKIDHPSLVQGDRARMKTLTIDPNEDIDMSTINEVLVLAKSFYDK